jgi:hypothetical protein
MREERESQDLVKTARVGVKNDDLFETSLVPEQIWNSSVGNARMKNTKDNMLEFVIPPLVFVDYNSAEYKAKVAARVAFWREAFLPTFIDQWTPALHALSVRTVMVPLPKDYDAWCKADGSPGAVAAFVPTFEALRANFPGGDAFFKLGSRSPKDFWAWNDTSFDRAGVQPRNPTSTQLACAFLNSERIWHDTFDARDGGYTPVICAREWISGAEPHREFRCFMRNRELVGMSVYRAWDPEPKPEIVADPDRWSNAIRAWFPKLLASTDLSNIVFDVMVLDDRVVLVEINPNVGSTYPAHFLEKPLDGRLRYLGDGDSDVVN